MQGKSVLALVCSVVLWAPAGISQTPYERAAEEAREQYVVDTSEGFRRESAEDANHPVRPLLFARGKRSTTLVLLATNFWTKEAVDSYMDNRLSRWLELGFKNVVFAQVNRSDMKKKDIIRFSFGAGKSMQLGVFASFQIGKKK